MRSGLSYTTQQRPLPISAIGKGRLRFLPAGMLPPLFLSRRAVHKGCHIGFSSQTTPQRIALIFGQ